MYKKVPGHSSPLPGVSSSNLRPPHIPLRNQLSWPCSLPDPETFLPQAPTREELIACDNSVEEIRQITGADSLGYLSLEGLRRTAASETKQGICDACFSDEYPIPVDPAEELPQLSLFRDVEQEDD